MLTDFQNFRTAGKCIKFAIKCIRYIILCKHSAGMAEMQTNCIIIASNFVIHPQILIFSMFKIASFSHVITNKIFHVTVFYLFIFTINFWH